MLACTPESTGTRTPGDAPNEPANATPVTRASPAEPAPASSEAMCAGLDPAFDERVRVRIEDMLGDCRYGALTGCMSDTRYDIANCSDEPVEVRMLAHINRYRGTIYSLKRGTGGTMVGDDTVQIAPGAVWSLTVGYFEDPDDRLRIDVVDMSGAPIPLRARPVRVSNPARQAALAACAACEGTWDHRDDHGCNCKTSDAGQACDDDDACEGQCLFDHWQVSTPVPRPRCKGKHCAATPSGIGRPIGFCSVRTQTRCDHFLERGIAGQPDRPLPWGVDWTCGCLGAPFDPTQVERSEAGRRERGEFGPRGSAGRAHEPPWLP